MNAWGWHQASFAILFSKNTTKTNTGGYVCGFSDDARHEWLRSSTRNCTKPRNQRNVRCEATKVQSDVERNRNRELT